MKFIKVLKTNSFETYVNTDHIIRIREQNPNCILVLSNGEELYLQMSAEKVIKLIGD